jgi:dTDP-4-amino-4,6-dideoxy-D-galactose acyltransferase
MVWSKPLSWDTDFFKIQIARVDAEAPAGPPLRKTLRALFDGGTSLVYLFSDTPLPEEEFFGSSARAVDVGAKVYFSKALSERAPAPASVVSYPRGVTSDALYALALQSGMCSRFRLDPGFHPEDFERLYRRWIENAVDRVIADEVFVWQEGGVEKGMVTVGVRGGIGDIGLLAVDSGSRGRQIGQSLLRSAQNFLLDRGVRELGVWAQLRNTGACRFYEAQGFRRTACQYVYHCWAAEAFPAPL